MSNKRSKPSCIKITVAARGSPLSRIQVQEVLKELQVHHPDVDFTPLFVMTRGDRDRATSLRTLERSDFFTREIDALILAGEVRLGIHSAKDLPEPLSHGLKCVAVTRGIDPSDSLVMRDKGPLPPGAIVATSSLRREACVAALYPHAHFIDIRGTIEERLQCLIDQQVDAVVIAEAALIRLGLTEWPRIRLPGPTAPLQGKLAVVAAQEDEEMATLFACLHC